MGKQAKKTIVSKQLNYLLCFAYVRGCIDTQQAAESACGQPPGTDTFGFDGIVMQSVRRFIEQFDNVQAHEFDDAVQRYRWQYYQHLNDFLRNGQHATTAHPAR